MTDRNDTIERLRDIRDRAVVSDGMFTERAAYIVKLIDDTLELLKEQEPRVLTLDEVENQKQSGGLWLDSRDNDWTPMAVLLYEVDKKKVTFMSRIGLKFYANKDRTGQYGNYGTDWRCWSSKPTDEQREGTPWQE